MALFIPCNFFFFNSIVFDLSKTCFHYSFYWLVFINYVFIQMDLTYFTRLFNSIILHSNQEKILFVIGLVNTQIVVINRDISVIAFHNITPSSSYKLNVKRKKTCAISTYIIRKYPFTKILDKHDC